MPKSEKRGQDLTKNKMSKKAKKNATKGGTQSASTSRATELTGLYTKSESQSRVASSKRGWSGTSDNPNPPKLGAHLFHGQQLKDITVDQSSSSGSTSAASSSKTVTKPQSAPDKSLKETNPKAYKRATAYKSVSDAAHGTINGKELTVGGKKYSTKSAFLKAVKATKDARLKLNTLRHKYGATEYKTVGKGKNKRKILIGHGIQKKLNKGDNPGAGR